MDTPAPATIAGVRSWRMGFALLGGAVAWAGHLLFAYAIAEFGCVAGLGRSEVLGVTVVSWMLLAVSALFTAMAGAAVLVSRRIGQGQSTPAQPGERGERAARAALVEAVDGDDRSTREFAARFGLICNGLFLFTVLVQSVPVFYYWGRC